MVILTILLMLILLNFIFLGLYYIFFNYSVKNYEHKIKPHITGHFGAFKDFCYISLVPIIGIFIHIWGIVEIFFYIKRAD